MASTYSLEKKCESICMKWTFSMLQLVGIASLIVYSAHIPLASYPNQALVKDGTRLFFAEEMWMNMYEATLFHAQTSGPRIIYSACQTHSLIYRILNNVKTSCTTSMEQWWLCKALLHIATARNLVTAVIFFKALCSMVRGLILCPC